MSIETLYDRLEKVAYYSNVPEELAYITTNITPKECAEILKHFRELNNEIERLNKKINEYEEREEMQHLIKDEERFNYSMSDQVDY